MSTSVPTPLVELQQVTFGYGARVILDGISLTVVDLLADGFGSSRFMPALPVHSEREDVDVNGLVTLCGEVIRQQIQLRDRRVANGKTADAAVLAVNEDVAARMVRIREDAVGLIGVIQAK